MTKKLATGATVPYTLVTGTLVRANEERMGESVFTGASQVIAVGDLHGNFAGFRRILQRCGVIDKRDRWMARGIHLVQLGDVLGRGGEPGKIFRLLKRLEEEAGEFDSRVHILLGNHEAMSMSGMLMYNTLEEFRDLAEEDLLEAPVEAEAQARHGHRLGAPDPRMDKRLDMMGCREFRDSLSPEGKVGHWLAQHDSAVRIDDTLFVHGGLNRTYGLQPLQDLNDAVRRELFGMASAPPSGDWSPVRDEIMLRRDGPQWNREFTLRPGPAKQAELEEVLAYHGCKRMVVGHTPTSCVDPSRAGEIVSLYGGRLFCADTGIGKAYGGNLSALRIAGDVVSAEYP